MARHTRTSAVPLWRPCLLVGLVVAAGTVLLWALMAPRPDWTDGNLRPVTPAPAITWEPAVSPTGSAPTAAVPTPSPEPRR